MWSVLWVVTLNVEAEYSEDSHQETNSGVDGFRTFRTFGRVFADAD